jgi:hypothetical protein
MKEKPVEHVADTPVSDGDDWPDIPTAHSGDKPGKSEDASPPKEPRNLEKGKKQKWYDVIDFKKMVPLLPMLRRVRGSKKNVTIPVFTELNDSAQSIFERNKTLFRFRTQVDLMAYYWGMRVLEQIYLVHKGLPVSRLSKLLEDKEARYAVYDDMKTVKELFQKDMERFKEGIVGEEEVHKHWTEYLATFENAEDRGIMNGVLEKMLAEGEEDKARDRVRKRSEYNRSKLKVIGAD